LVKYGGIAANGDRVVVGHIERAGTMLWDRE
jgi:hypothetical protein